MAVMPIPLAFGVRRKSALHFSGEGYALEKAHRGELPARVLVGYREGPLQRRLNGAFTRVLSNLRSTAGVGRSLPFHGGVRFPHGQTRRADLRTPIVSAAAEALEHPGEISRCCNDICAASLRLAHRVARHAQPSGNIIDCRKVQSRRYSSADICGTRGP